MNPTRMIHFLMALIFLVGSSFDPALASGDANIILPTQMDVNPDQVEFLSFSDIQFKDKKYHLGLESEDFKFFSELTVEQKEKFLSARSGILSKFVAIFSVARVFAGAGAVVKNKVFFWKPQQKSMSEVYQETSHRVTEKALTAIDKKIWLSAEVIANSNEIALDVMPRIFAGLSFREKGFFPGIGLGFSFVYNTKTKDFAFEVYGEYLKLKDSYPLAGGVYGGVAFGFRKSKDLMEKTGLRESDLFYLPGPLGIANSPKEFTFVVAPALSFGLFNMLFDVKDLKLASFKHRRKNPNLNSRVFYCGHVHLNVSN